MSRATIVDGWRIEITIREGVRRVMTRAEIAAAVASALMAAGAPPETALSVILTDDEELADLNETHLGHDGPTDVLSFPLLPPGAFPAHPGSALARVPDQAFALPPGARLHLGDIAVSVERAAAQAADGRGGQTSDVRWSTQQELRLLLTHGTLHVCGWDHAEPIEEAAMRALERDLLGFVPD